MRKINNWLFGIIFLFAASTFAATSPIPMLDNAAQQIISVLKQNKSALKSNPQIIKNAIRQYLLPIVDVEGMSRSVLSREVWATARSDEKEAFKQEFTNLVIRTYANPLAEYSDDTVKFISQKSISNAKFTKVSSFILRTSGQKIPLTYSLVLKNGSWKVYDLSVEGVSLIQSFRSQFSGAMQNKDLSSLVIKMKQRKV